MTQTGQTNRQDGNLHCIAKLSHAQFALMCAFKRRSKITTLLLVTLHSEFPLHVKARSRVSSHRLVYHKLCNALQGYFCRKTTEMEHYPVAVMLRYTVLSLVLIGKAISTVSISSHIPIFYSPSTAIRTMMKPSATVNITLLQRINCQLEAAAKSWVWIGNQIDRQYLRM